MSRFHLVSGTALGFGSLGIFTLGLSPCAAVASDGIKLSVGGFFNTAYQVNFDDNGKGELGHDHNTDGLFTHGNIWFEGKTTLDNGVTVGAHVELEVETAEDQIDEAYISFSGDLGMVRVGSFGDALEEMCVTPPGATANFGAFSPDMIAANISGAGLSSNTVCTGLSGDGQKIAYFTPEFGGFQLGLSYTPNAEVESQADGSGPHVGMPEQAPGQARHDGSVYAIYRYEGDGWGLEAGGGVAFDGAVENDASTSNAKAVTYQAGLNLTVESFSVGGAFEYFDDVGIVDGTSLTRARGARSWFAGIGMAYDFEPWTVGLQYSYGDSELATVETDDETVVETGGSGADVIQQRVALTGIYALGPGIDLDAEIAYTWLDSEVPGDDAVDDYDALEVGLGTSFTF